MTKDEIEKLAVEAGWPLFAIQMLAGTEDEKRLQRFAELVVAAEREACAKVCEGRIGGAVQSNDWWAGFKTAMKQSAAAIRARGNA